MIELEEFDVEESSEEEVQPADFVQIDNWAPMYEVIKKPIAVHVPWLDFPYCRGSG